MFTAFDPTGANAAAYAQMTGQQLTKSQVRFLKINKLVESYTGEDYAVEDQLVHIQETQTSPGKVVRVTGRHAAELIVDGKAVPATDEQTEEYNTEVELAQTKIRKQLDKQDLAKAMSRVIKD